MFPIRALDHGQNSGWPIGLCSQQGHDGWPKSGEIAPVLHQTPMKFGKNRRNGKTLPSSIHLELTGSQWRQSCLPRTSVAQWKIWGTLGMPLGWSVLVSISYVVFKPAFNPSGVRVLNSLQYILSYYHYSHYRYMVPSCCCDVFSNSSGMASVSWPTPSSPFQVTPQIASPAPLATLCCFRGAPKNLHMADSGSLQNVVPAKGHVHSTWSNWRNTSSKSSC